MSALVDHEWSNIMQDAAGHRFSSESSESSGAWEALSPATEKFRARAGYPEQHPINERTGEMRRYLRTAETDFRASDGLVSGDWPERASGELLHKIQVAQGASKRRADARTPARPVIDATEDHLDEMADRMLVEFGRAVS